jgi:hypothetical protein
MADIKAFMPKQTFPPVGSDDRDPTCKEVYALYEATCANARKIPSARGDGLLGHFNIIAGPGRYVELSVNGIAFIPPPQPTAQPAHGASAATRDLNARLHAAEVKEFITYNLVSEIILQQMLSAVHSNYTASFKTREGGYTCSPYDLMDYLFSNFGAKTDDDLDSNKADMLKPWDASKETIQYLFTRVDEGRLFDPSITEVIYVRDTKNIICKNPGFKEAYTTWEGLVAADKMWINLQMHFRSHDKANRAFTALTAVPSQATYPGSANSATTPGSPGTTTTPPTEAQMILTAMTAMTKAVNKLTSMA